MTQGLEMFSEALFVQITGAQNDAIHCIMKIGLNLFDVTRCNGLHHKNRNDFDI